MASPQRRYTIKGLMIAIALVGAGVAALLRPNQGWAIVLPVFFLTLLLTALLGVLLRRGPRRAFWIGFALFGWAYMATFALGGDDLRGPFSPDHVVIGPLAGMLEILMVPGLGDEVQGADLTALGQVDDGSRFAVAYSTLGLLFAGLGGLIAHRLSRDDAPQSDRRGESIERGADGRAGTPMAKLGSDFTSARPDHGPSHARDR